MKVTDSSGGGGLCSAPHANPGQLTGGHLLPPPRNGGGDGETCSRRTYVVHIRGSNSHATCRAGAVCVSVEYKPGSWRSLLGNRLDLERRGVIPPRSLRSRAVRSTGRTRPFVLPVPRPRLAAGKLSWCLGAKASRKPDPRLSGFSRQTLPGPSRGPGITPDTAHIEAKQQRATRSGLRDAARRVRGRPLSDAVSTWPLLSRRGRVSTS